MAFLGARDRGTRRPVRAIPLVAALVLLPGGEAAAANLVAEAIEVTQGVQSLRNSVALVEGKRTYVRFYASASDGFHFPRAHLFVRRPGVPGDTRLLPLNPDGRSIVFAAPRDIGPLGSARASKDVGFVFELPSFFTSGTIEISATVNVDNTDPPESNLADNVVTTRVSFDEVVPNPDLTFYLLTYQLGGSTFATDRSHADQAVDWLRRAYPVAGVDYTLEFARWVGGTSSAVDPDTGVLNLTRPSCGDLNQAIAVVEGLNLGERRGPTVARTYGRVRSIGMVDDSGAFMRGCAGVPGPVASGPTGTATWGWDTDGSYGDWYTSHELSHTYGREHANFCGAEGGPPFRYPLGRISRPNPLLERIFGFDVATRDVYSHLWKDNMTYCDRQWLSDLNYGGIRRFLQDPGFLRRRIIDAASSSAGPAGSAAEPAAAGSLLSVVAAIDPVLDGAELQPAFRIDEAAQVPPPDPGGTHAIVLRDDAGKELLRYGFTPLEEHAGPPWPGSRASEVRRLFVAQAVPFGVGTRRLDLEGPGGTLLASLRPGPSPAVVKIVTPLGQKVVDGEPVELAWDAKDPDGDELTFVVQYRPDDASPWRSVGLPTTETSAVIPFENLPSGEQARFRVWASDGINTTIAESPAFVVANRPPSLDVLSPRSGAVFVEGQAIALEAHAYDADAGGLDGEHLQWSSSRDGLLGKGRQLTVASLSEGRHVIEVRADDGRGKQASIAVAEVEIEVVGDFAQLPKQEPRLVAGPSELLVTPSGAFRRASLVLYEPDQRGVRWTAKASEPWVRLSRRKGVTPALIEVSVRKKNLEKPLRPQEATILIDSPDLAGPPIEVRVHFQTVKHG